MLREKKFLYRSAVSLFAAAIALSVSPSFPVISMAEEQEGAELITETSSAAAIGGLTDFSSIRPELLEIDEDSHTVTLGSTGGDHPAVYNGMERPTDDFVLEADVRLLGGDDENALSAALIFGVENPKTPLWKWYGANIDTARKEGSDLFRLFGPGVETNSGGEKGEIDIEAPLHLKLDVAANGDFTYSFGNAGDAQLRSITGFIPDWQGGYVGVLSFRSQAEFSNISFTDRTAEQKDTGTAVAYTSFKTDLTDLTAYGGVWEDREDGLYSNAVDLGNTLLYSQMQGTDFVYSTDVTFLQNSGTASLIFRSGSDDGRQNAYGLNLDGWSKICRFTRWQDGSTYQMIDDRQIDSTEDETYRLKVVAVGSWISCYVNDVLVASTGDYVLQPGNRGQNTFLAEGYFGLQNLNGEVIFQNTRVIPLNEENTPLLTDIAVVPQAGTIEEKSQFIPTEPARIQYVGNDAETVDIEAVPANDSAIITVQNDHGITYPDGKSIPLKEGANYLTVTSTVENPSGPAAAVSYRVNVWRRQADDIYYKEAHRDQYHYSVKDGWVNDPNGLVYYNGTWHLFYQFYAGTAWGPMHWAHAVSKDLITWEDRPIAFYPDANGAMFSGCIVADENNTSGLFSGENGGLVALITADGNGQRIKVAYSEDEGTTWTKLDKIAADWTDDPLVSTDFRDPKVFRWEGKWFMVVAGGPLRIYSSDNLLDWTCESAYRDLHTECPDLYPVQAADGTLKWVLSRGGRLYKVGDFREEDGHWTFIPDEAYASEDGIMNFGRDSYAAMTYYIQDFGTAEAPALPELIELNWMNTWDDYCNQVGETLHQNFNGTFNLNLNIGLTLEDGVYKLTQTPIAAYETLRDEENAVILEGTEADENNTLLSDFSGDCYEIVSTFTPGADTQKVGFRLRTGEKEETLVLYDLENDTISIDRSKSGTIISEKFAEVTSQTVKRNEDGTVDLHIYVDRASVEVFTGGGTAAGAAQIFPDETSLGAGVVVEGGAATVDLAVYPMSSIWGE